MTATRSEQVSTMTSGEPGKPSRRRIYLLVALLGLSAFMYVSIMYKIINYGP